MKTEPNMMNHLLRLAAFLSITLMMGACKSGKLSPEADDKLQIRYGSGGGFTGAVTTYALLQSGRLYEHQSMGADSFAYILTVPKEQSKALFEEFSSLGIDTTTYHTYGNFTHFLEWHLGADSNRVSWASDDKKVPEAWTSIYARLKQLNTPVE